ncbi:glycosyltransferase [Candidatus Saccharibacteria bacterium]|nr:glycosyltransferase [Candidatus Saccharibacteria bacterium]
MPETLSSSSQPAQTPAEETQEDDPRFQVQIADVSHAVASNAVDSAEELINQQTQVQEGQRLGRSRAFLRRIWYGNIARDFYRQRQIRHGRGEIIETGNIYALDEGSQADHDRETGAVVERLASDNLHEGERNEDLESTEHGRALMDQVRQLIGEYARGAIDHDALVEERTRILSEYGARVHDQDRNRGLMYADNILEVAENVRLAHGHQEGLDRLDEAIAGRIGEARMGVRTEVRMEATDRILNWMHEHHMTFANEAVIGAAVGIAMGLAKFTTKKAITATGAVVGLGVGAGVIAGAREHLRVGQERRTHLRQRAEGQQMPEEEAVRREQFEATRYETVSAEELTNNIQEALDGLDPTSPDSVRVLLAHVSNARARIAMSDERDIDLIEYSAKIAVESERLNLDILLAQASETLQQAIDDSAEGTFPSRNLDELVGANFDAINEYFEADIDQKDRAFRRLRWCRTMKMAGIAFIAGETLGLAAQEIHALTDSGLRGVFEGDGGDRRSLLAGWLFGGSKASDGSELHRDFFEGPEYLTDQTHKVGVDLPEGYQLIHARPGEQFGWDIIDSDSKPVLDRGLEWDTQGNLAKWVRHDLTEKGWNLHQDTLTYNDPDTVAQSVTRSPQEFIEKHPREFIRIHRELWYDNNTPAPNFDLNELRQYWGGESGTGIDKNGNYVFNIANMRPDWSFHGAEAANAPQLIQEGKMYVALSMTRGTQQWVEMIPVDGNGNAIIDADSFAGKNLFEAVDGHAHFKGAFAEAVQVTGQTQDGGVSARMLATVVGENKVGSITDTVQRTVTEQHTHFLTVLEAPSEDLPVEIPPVLPIYARRGLEELTRPEGPGYGYYRGGESYLGGSSEGRGRRGVAPFAPELEANPDAKIDANKSTTRYLRSLRPSYKKTLGGLKSQLEKQPKVDKPKIVIMVPAAAHQEGNNIYRTLEQYAKQQGVPEDDFEIVVFANNPAGSKPDKTIREIRRFQNDNPNIKVRLMHKELQSKEANIGWVRKAVTDTIITDLMERGVDLNDVLLVSNDADSQWIDPNYLKTIVERATTQPEVDGFLGFIDWGYDAYKAHPETLAATRLMQMIEIYLRKKRNEIGSSGANFVFRPGIYTAVGGYRSGTSLGEDVELGRMIKSVRAGAQTRRPIAFLGRSSEINTSARRALEKLFKDGGAPAAQWDEVFSAYDDLRTKDFNLRDLDFSDQAAVDRVVDNTETMLNQTLDMYRSSLTTERATSYKHGRLNLLNSEVMRNLNRMLTIIGVKVNWHPDGKFTITDASRMVANLRRWQAAH